MEKTTKKELKKEGVLELRTRVYNQNTVEAINELWDKHARWCRNNKNEFINELLYRGTESWLLEERNIAEAMWVDTILNRLDKIEAKLKHNQDYLAIMFQQLYVQNQINYTILTRLYHIIFRLECANGMKSDIYDTGALDGLRTIDNLYEKFCAEFEALEDKMYGR